MASAPKPRLWTSSEYERLAETGILGSSDHVELIDGEIIQMSPKKSRHATAVELAAEVLKGVYGAGYSVRNQNPLALDDSSEPEPDIAVVRGSIRDFADEHPTRAELVVEVSDTSLAYDRTRKAAVYARAGIPEYWIVNLVEGQVEVHCDPSAPGYRSRSVSRPGDTVRCSAGPLPVADLLP